MPIGRDVCGQDLEVPVASMTGAQAAGQEILELCDDEGDWFRGCHAGEGAGSEARWRR